MNRNEKIEMFIRFATNERQLLNKYAERAVGKSDAEDCVQDTLLKIYQNIDKFKRPYNMHSWAWKIFTNTIKNHYTAKNKKKRIPNNKLVSLDCLYNVGTSQDESPLNDEIVNAYNSMNPKFKKSFKLCVLENMTYVQAAKKIGIPKGTLMSRINRARICMRETLK